ncbi:N-acetylmuramoyl-L-alanine amidase [Rhodobacter capsulatus]|jgi:N-acetylmuramoyl-L-alanine amidase|uniref:N-acetylmuramoyl-L-alanine amidase n=1 Tax=Rhodobacter capsulatus (strain ATCC BAA-309 / NBRC 16581 / SB1003) TaxID=272942 RepID=D5AU51_RHOCB|nr:N-acetylmuramoyl-L-alanine amidase [Rhodobacter capsulatus]ADE85490.1 N-acetylmuramoyl-L-alanine amidase AmiC [Rhodobacter capsulatus SB 1003]ETD01525.1 N-acetylmuramoyl-L-alanine amidase [Rhodobacter capsulatus DE442]ETD76592.1 N-acetylmuramoyl-L-alanine amidase [Rhodobacter capsulatus R121]ETD84551.1 N-acetylmuramoyl-L-alanine amidase [Rhodobacter capsulatus YW1]ETE53428.1 N-acetylmuramoyl-L-alanine amidase [Rhodobacter capsulatus Y262]
MARIFLVLAALWALAVPASAQGPQLSALARLEPARTSVAQPSAFVTEVTLGLSQPVPFRAFLLDAPPRLVVDFREVDFSAANPKDYAQKGLLGEIRWGAFRPGWSRFVAELTGPVRLVSAEERTGETPNLHLVLERVEAADFVARDGAAQSALWDLPQPAPTAAPHRRQDGSAPLRVVLDPGHGGLDPGAEADGYSEAVLVLTFARELKEALTRAGIEVKMTREENIFVPLDARLTLAHEFGADLFLSLHADALPEGEAMGATVYLFDETASDSAAQKLAERHDRADLLAGVDLAGHDDAVAGVLMDLARTETQPRAVRFGQVLSGAIKGEGLRMHRHPVQGADFAVLRSPDIPSALLELGFMSSDIDRARLHDETWRTQMVAAITAGVQRWAKADAAEARLLRQ